MPIKFGWLLPNKDFIGLFTPGDYMATNIKKLAESKQPIYKAGRITRIILPNGSKYEASANGIFENPPEYAKIELARFAKLNPLDIGVECPRTTKVDPADVTN